MSNKGVIILNSWDDLKYSFTSTCFTRYMLDSVFDNELSLIINNEQVHVYSIGSHGASSDNIYLFIYNLEVCNSYHDKRVVIFYIEEKTVKFLVILDASDYVRQCKEKTEKLNKSKLTPEDIVEMFKTK